MVISDQDPQLHGLPPCGKRDQNFWCAVFDCDCQIDPYARPKNLCWLTASTAATKSRPASDFTTYPLALALNASRIICGELCCVTIKISDSGTFFRICRQASSPFILGMLKSSTTTSGLRRSAFSTASTPSSASSTISHSGLRPSKVLSPCRTTG